MRKQVPFAITPSTENISSHVPWLSPATVMPNQIKAETPQVTRNTTQV